MPDFYRVRRWNESFETNRTRILKTLTWVPIPNSLDSDGYTELVDHSNGAAHFGIWIALVEAASQCRPRGTLARSSGQPHTAASLARITRLPQSLIEEAIERLLTIGWLETWHLEGTDVPEERHDEDTTVPEERQRRKDGRTDGRSEDRTDGIKTEQAGSPSAAASGDRPHALEPEPDLYLAFPSDNYSPQELEERRARAKPATRIAESGGAK